MLEGMSEYHRSGKHLFTAALFPDSSGFISVGKWGGNPIGHLLNRCLYIPPEPLSLDVLVGLDDNVRDFVKDFDFKPRSFAVSSFDDFRNYSNPYSFGVAFLLKGFDPENLRATKSIAGEHFVSHPTVFGSVVDSSLSGAFDTSSTFNIGNFQFSTAMPNDFYHVVGVNEEYIPYFSSLLGGSYAPMETCLSELFDQLDESPWTYTFVTVEGSKTYQTSWDISDLKILDSENPYKFPLSFEVFYAFHIDELYVSDYYAYRYHRYGRMLITITEDTFSPGFSTEEVPVDPRAPIVSHTLSVQVAEIAPIYCRQRDNQASWPPFVECPNLVLEFQHSSCLVNANVVDSPTMQVKLNNLHGSPALPARGATFLDSIDNWMDSIMGDLRPGTFYSTYDAVSPLIELMSNNFLEDLTNLSGIAGYLPDVIPLMKSIKKLKNGDVGGGVVKVIDFLSSTQLLVDFSISPDLDTASEVLSNLDKVSAILHGIDTLHGVYRGKITVPLPNYILPFCSESILTIRSKVVVEFRESAIWSMIFGAEAAGLLPRLGNLWDLVPFSFVADWFLNIGGRLDAVDHSVFLAAFNIRYLVHSFDIVGLLSDEFLDLHGLSSSPLGGIPPSLRIYRREVSKYTPALRDSRIDFLQANGIPSFRTAGSLVWQVLT